MCQWSLWTTLVHATRSVWCRSTSGTIWIYLPSLWRVVRGSDYFRISFNGKKRYSSTLSLTSELYVVGGQRHAPAALPRERPGTHCMGVWVGSRAGLDRCRKLAPTGIRSPDRSRVPKVSKICNFLQSGITTLRASKPVAGSNINNCLSLLPKHPVRLWGPATHPLVQWGPGDSFLGWSCRGVKLATPLNLMPALRISRSYTSVLPVCFRSAWKDNCTCTSTLKCWLFIDADIKAAYVYVETGVTSWKSCEFLFNYLSCGGNKRILKSSVYGTALSTGTQLSTFLRSVLSPHNRVLFDYWGKNLLQDVGKCEVLRQVVYTLCL